MSPYEVWCIAEGQKAADLKQWKRARFIGWCAISAMGAQVDIVDLLPLEGDERAAPLTVEEMRELVKKAQTVR